MKRAVVGVWAGLSLVGQVACSQSAKPDKPAATDDAAVATSEPTPTPAGARPAVAWADSAQLVLGVSDDWDDTTIELTSFNRDGATWTAVATWDAVIGHTGLAWGKGAHGDGAPEDRSGPVKTEGDGKSPAGVFAIGKAYGYARSAPLGASVPYTPVDGKWRCIDDPASAHYTRILDESTVTKDWRSAETMKRRDELYRWVVEIEHNAGATPGGGSCIFFHLWRDPEGATVGCAAMGRDEMESMIAWLDPTKKPVVVLLPRAELDALRKTWQLPD